jgi:hypothetical protein
VKVLKKIYESTQTIGFTSPSSSVTYWIEQLNALVMIGTTVNKHETYRIYRDGTALRTGQFSTNGDSLHVDQAPEVDGGLAINSQINWSDVLQMHPISSTFNVQKPFFYATGQEYLSTTNSLPEATGEEMQQPRH